MITLNDLFILATKRGLDFHLTTKTRPNDSFYVTVHNQGVHATVRKAFTTEAEMLAALQQRIAEVSVAEPDDTDLLADFEEPINADEDIFGCSPTTPSTETGTTRRTAVGNTLASSTALRTRTAAALRRGPTGSRA